MKKDEINFLSQDSRSLYSTLIICLVVFVLAISGLIFVFNRLILTHDQYLSGEMCTLLSEKVNNSIEAMTDSTRGISEVLSAQNYDSPYDIYEQLKYTGNSECLSIGFIDEEFNIYAGNSERQAIYKWNLLETAKEADPISMSVPYRSAIYGQYVITIFSEFKYGSNKQGYVFTTYKFKTLQEVVSTKSLVNDIEVSLINAGSANVIQCLGSENHPAGSWTNAYLALQEISKTDRTSYIAWLKRMFDGEDNVGLSYNVGDVLYTQNSVSIQNMPGWYVSVRIPGAALSETMHTFRNYVLIFAVVLLVIVVVLIVNMYYLSKQQTNVLKQLSVYDPLTGVFNRRAFDLVAERMLGKKKKCALIFFDIDYFKQVNDTYGHDAGDKILKSFAAILGDCFSDKGIVSRFGGDEFVVLTEMEEIRDINIKLKQAAEALGKLKISDDETQTTAKFHFSAGAAQYPVDADNLSNLKKCADGALYIVKENGRNGRAWYQYRSKNNG